MSFPELLSKLAVAPLYIIQVILCIVFLIYSRKERGFLVAWGKIYSVIILGIYLIALYYHFF